ncbi:MAG: glycosyltransferase [Gammaproteobacteria bacterium]|nr:glycosyltransferase [Gammaproteobacteria bacterium]
MKILYVVGTYDESGGSAAQPFVKSQIDSVHNEGHDVEVYNVRGNESNLNYLKAIPRIRSLIKNKNFDVVHGHYTYCGLVAACQRIIPSFVSFMGSDLQGTPRENGRLSLHGHIDVWLSRLAQVMVKGKIVKSQGMYSALVNKSNTLVLPNGVNFDLFHPVDQLEARRALGLDENKKYVLFAGSYKNRNKCFHVVKEAVDLLKERYDNVELLLAHGLSHEKIPLYMNAANTLALASMKEGSPNVVKEAMACNLPVISTDVGDVSEVINGVDGCFIVDRTAEAFSERIEYVIGNVNRTEGREAIADLAIERVADRLVDFYAGFMNSNSKRNIQ